MNSLKKNKLIWVCLIIVAIVETSCVGNGAGNYKILNFYGKVIDQYGHPVVGAEVAGNVDLLTGPDSDEKYKHYKTKTDSNGLFQFTWKMGAGISAWPSKPGYELAGYGEGYKGPVGNKTSPTDRAIYTMWKERGPEPMIHVDTHTYIPCDGSEMQIDLLSGKKTPDGDLIVKLIRDPVEIIRGKPFNWSVTLEIQNGGMQVITNMYPNEAPIDGYQSKFAFNFSANMQTWTSDFGKSFYFKSKDGKIYGRIVINIKADFQPPPTYFGTEIYANPAGSRNLEFDYKKQIR